MEGKIDRSRKGQQRQLRGAGQCFNVINDTVSMLRGCRYHRMQQRWILD